MENNRVLWLKVWSIAAVQGAITLSWVIYNLYLSRLLVQLGLTEQVAIAILIGENALEAIIEPVFGGFSDRQQRFLGNRTPIIILGIILSSALFLAILSVVIFNSSGWLLIVLAVAWASAMAIFRSPTMALLGRCAPTNLLPQAASVLSLVGGVIGAFRFDAYGIILKMGAGFAFALGSFSLLAAGAFLRWLNPPEVATGIKHRSSKISRSRLSLIFVTGIGMGWSLRFLIPTISKVLSLQLGQDNSKIVMTLFFVALGLMALPAGKIGTKLGNCSAMIWGALITILGLILFVLAPSLIVKYIAIAFLVMAYSLVLNGTIPLALSLVNLSHSGLATGMYFGGLNAGISLFEFIFFKLGKADISQSTTGTILSLLLVLICLIVSQDLFKNNSVKITNNY
ncbi:MAG: SLC45 family MFS transporter [Pleurocapsa sp.]